MNNSSKENTTIPSANITPEQVYGLSCGCGKAPAGYCIPSMDEILALNAPSSSPAADNSPALAQAEVAYEQGGSTSETIPPSPSVNQYSGNLQHIPFIADLNAANAANAAAAADSSAVPLTPATANLGASLGGVYAVTPENLRYHNGFMRTQIGRRVTVDFLVGSNTIVQKTGYLLGVAQDYILLNELDTNDITTCDYYNIKFIRYYY